ncbi:MAG: translation initiation factor [Thermanaerothrix sp.]|nr:translation initiation factor [Thermanaerothrix sp.]
MVKKKIPLQESVGDINSLGAALRSAGLELGPQSPGEGSQRKGKPSSEASAGKEKKDRVGLSASLSIRRKGLGGHQCTAVLVKGLSAEELKGLCKSLKTALGCGARVEEGEVLVQGDQRERLKAVLSRMGFRVSEG